MMTDSARSLFKMTIVGLALLCLASCADKPATAPGLVEEAGRVHDSASQSENGIQPDHWLEIEKLLRQAVELDPGHLPAHRAMVKALWDQDKHLEAVRMAQDLNTRFPSDPGCWELSGDLFFRISQWEKALNAFSQALDQGADPKVLLIKKGTAAGKNGNFELAFETFDAALDADGPKDVIHYNFGLCYEGTKQYEMALSSFEQSLEENPSHLPSIMKLMEFHQEYIGPFEPDFEMALEYAKKAYELKPADIKVLSNLADMFMSKKDYASALKLVEDAQKMHPDEPELEKYKVALEKLIQQESGREAGE